MRIKDQKQKKVGHRAIVPLSKRIDHSIELLLKNEKVALQFKDFGYHLAFSGGKDSQAVHELCKMAGVKFKGFFYKQSVDPPSILKMIREEYPEVEWLRPKETMYQMIFRNGCLPHATNRYCCKVLKERNGQDAVVLTGIRSEESTRRSWRKEIEFTCINGSDRIMLHPVFNWSERDVYAFLEMRNIKLNELYKVLGRVGCIGCPMSPTQQRKQFSIFPNFKKAYVNTIKRLMNEKGKFSDFESAEQVIEWWTSGVNKKDWFESQKQSTMKFE